MDSFIKKNSKLLSILFVFIALPTFVGCSDRNNDLIEVSGTAIDSYLQGATVCIDENKNKLCDEGEPRSVTDTNGAFSIGTFSSSPILILADPNTTKKSTIKGQIGESITKTFFMSAPNNAKVITPLTTLVQVGVEQGVYDSFSMGATAVLSSLNIPSSNSVDLLNFDYILANNPAVAVTAEMIVSSLANAISKVESVTSDDQITKSNVLSSAVLILIDPNIAGKTGTSLMDEIGAAVESLGVSDDINNINFDTVISNLEVSMTNDGVGFADDLTDDEVESIIVVVNDPDATGVSGETN